MREAEARAMATQEAVTEAGAKEVAATHRNRSRYIERSRTCRECYTLGRCSS